MSTRWVRDDWRSTRQRAGRVFSREVKPMVSSCEENFPTVLPVLLQLVGGPEGLPADEQGQETLRGKLRTLQEDREEVQAVFTELSAHLVSISSEDLTLFVSFRTFEELWKFSTYLTAGLLSRCLENLLLDQEFWLTSLEDEAAVEVIVQEETFNLIYRGILMQEGSLFASCSTNQMFDSCTSGGDLYLEQGDVAQFEPPFLGSGWTVLCLADGARGTAPRPALEPLVPFHQWFLKTGAESILLGDGKAACDFPLQYASGTCVAAKEHDAEGPDELSLAPGDRVVVMGRLVSCFGWFAGRKESTGEVGLVPTSAVEPCGDVHSSTDVCLEEEDHSFLHLHEDTIIEETTVSLKKRSQHRFGVSYQLDTIAHADVDGNARWSPSSRVDGPRPDLSGGVQTAQAAAPEVPPQEPDTDQLPRFRVQPILEGSNAAENFAALFSFLEGADYRPELGVLYGLSPQRLASSPFTGHAEEDELISFLGAAREMARKKRLFWCQTRVCFLLGKLCAGRLKFSQARVYLEEALSVPRENFIDLQLLTRILSNLAGIYLLQKNTQSLFGTVERLAALLFGIPDCLESLEDDIALKYILKKAILSGNKMAEARACLLLTRFHWSRAEGGRVVPYLERLLLLCQADKAVGLSSSQGYLVLGRLYAELGLLQLSVGSAGIASRQSCATLSLQLGCILLLLDSLARPRQVDEDVVPAQLAPCLRRALSLSAARAERQLQVLSYHLTMCLCRLFCEYGMVEGAVRQMYGLFRGSGPPRCPSLSAADRNSALIWLAWLHLDRRQPQAALDILDAVLATMPEHCTTPQEGVVLNMRGVALGCLGDVRKAAESYQAAADVCEEYEDTANWAVAQANQGLLCAKAGARALAQRRLTEAVGLFSRLDDSEHEDDFVAVLLQLGHSFVQQQRLDYGKGCYEWALLLCIRGGLLERQLTATRHLCELYEREGADQAQCIKYEQHRLQLLRATRARGAEADCLEALSQRYLSLGTERAYRAALDSTKTGLGVFIDLGCREKEARGWLQAGNIYHLLGQTELVDLYVQAAQEVALNTGDTGFILKILEAAGDIFFNSRQDRHKAIPFYRDRALAISGRSSSISTRLRLSNKLTDLMLSLKMYEEAVEFAQMALDISISQGEHLNERVAYHRLAVLYHCLDQYELAEHYYLKALSLCPTPLHFEEETLYYVKVYQTLGDITFYDLKDPFDAAGYYHLALAAAMDLGNKSSQLQLCTRLATIYHNFLVDRELSLFFYQKARRFAAELNVRRVNISADQYYSKGHREAVPEPLKTYQMT